MHRIFGRHRKCLHEGGGLSLCVSQILRIYFLKKQPCSQAFQLFGLLHTLLTDNLLKFCLLDTKLSITL